MNYNGFHADTSITFVNGTNVSIRDIVNKKLVGPIITYNEMNQQFEQTTITNWIANDKLDIENNEIWYSFLTTSPGNKNGVMGFTCSSNSKIFTKNKGIILAKNLELGDTLVSWYKQRIELNDYYKSIVYGSLLADGGIAIRTTSTGSLKLCNNEQQEYLQWKLEKLKDMEFSKILYKTKSNLEHYSSKYTVELKLLHDKFYHSGSKKRIIPYDLELDALMAAVWFMDDGYYRKDRHSARIVLTRHLYLSEQDVIKQMNKVQNMFSKFLNCKKDDIVITCNNTNITFNKEIFNLLCQKIYKYVPESMQYKLLPEYRNKYEEFDSGKLNKEKLQQNFVQVKDIKIGSPRKLRNKIKYNIELSNNSKYLVGGGQGVIIYNF